MERPDVKKMVKSQSKRQSDCLDQTKMNRVKMNHVQMIRLNDSRIVC